jgi:hypothetical protein
MTEAVINCSIDRCDQLPPHVCGDTEVIEKGQVEIIGTATATATALVVIAAAAADGATQRAADVAAGLAARADRYAPIVRCEDVTLPKKPGVDAIAAGTKCWWSVDDNYLVTALNQVDDAGVCWPCFQTSELSDDTADTVRGYFNGILCTSAAGTAT